MKLFLLAALNFLPYARVQKAGKGEQAFAHAERNN